MAKSYKIALCIIGTAIGICLCVAYGYALSKMPVKQCTSYYKYVDVLGREGTASNCYAGQGNLVCTNGNNRIQAAAYEYITYCK